MSNRGGQVRPGVAGILAGLEFIMPQYMLILRGDVTQEFDISPDQWQGIVQKYTEWSERLAKDGLLKAGHKLRDQGGKVIVPEGKNVSIKDGPYIETKEVVGGYYLISAKSYDHALELCEGHPNLMFGSIEVREVDFMGQPEG